jgi:foldase protein PrsA
MRSQRLVAASALVASWMVLATPASGQEVAAIVNGDRITVQDWIRRMQTLRAQDFLLSLNPVRMKSALGGQIALEGLINSRLITQYATLTSLLPSDADVEAEFQRVKTQPNIADGLTRGLFDEAQVRYDIRVQRALFNMATINQSVTQDEVKAYYDQHPEQWGQPERWQLAAIRVSSKALADKVAGEIKKGVPFATLATQYSEDSISKKAGGEIGTIPVNDPGLPEAVRQAVKPLKVGEITAPIQTMMPVAGGPARPAWFLVRKVGRIEANMRPFESVREDAQRLALLEKAGGLAAAQKKLDDYRKTAKIEIMLPAYKDVLKQTTASAK